MHSISWVIHLIYSVQQLPLQNNVSCPPIGVVIAQLVLKGRGGDQTGRERFPFLKRYKEVVKRRIVKCYKGKKYFCLYIH